MTTDPIMREQEIITKRLEQARRDLNEFLVKLHSLGIEFHQTQDFVTCDDKYQLRAWGPLTHQRYQIDFIFSGPAKRLLVKEARYD